MVKIQTMPSDCNKVTLREITEDTVRRICNLLVRDDQRDFVASNAESIAEAYFSKHAWFRAIYADEIPVGFVMLEDRPEESIYDLWRFMIDTRYQRMGFGGRAMALIIDYVKTRPNATEFLINIIQGEGGPQSFYEKLGFRLTGEYQEGEAVMKLLLWE